MSSKPEVARALISTYDKTGLIEFALQLCSIGIEILATGGTAQLLVSNKIKVTEIADYTGFPEIMGGRVKTLHPKIFGGLLRRKDLDDAILKQENILPIDLIVVNLYPFEKTIENPQCRFEQAIEQIDIGGPSLLRAAAKNHSLVTVIVDPKDYSKVISEIKNKGNTDLNTRLELALKVFEHTSYYDAIIANYFSDKIHQINIVAQTGFPNRLAINLKKECDLRYGENPHQKAALYAFSEKKSLAHAKQFQGKALSYNNFVDSDAAINCLRYFNPTIPACAIIKHATPCGVALGKNVREAYQLALQTDPESAFGGIIAVNQTLDKNAAEEMIQDQFIEVIIAPDYEKEALAVLSNKKNLRILSVKNTNDETHWNFRSISGGLLLQESDQLNLNEKNIKIVTKREPTEKELQDCLFAWKVVAMVKSNAIVYAKNLATLGIGAGQTSRVFSVKIAALKATQAHLSLANAVMASDAFFPFRDSIDAASKSGISAVIQPGGSKRDEEVIAAANEANIAMIFMGERHFRH